MCISDTIYKKKTQKNLDVGFSWIRLMPFNAIFKREKKPICSFLYFWEGLRILVEAKKCWSLEATYYFAFLPKNLQTACI